MKSGTSYLVLSLFLLYLFYIIYSHSFFYVFLLIIGFGYTFIFLNEWRKDKSNFLFKPPYFFTLITFIFQFLGGLFSSFEFAGDEYKLALIVKVNIIAFLAVSICFAVFNFLNEKGDEKKESPPDFWDNFSNFKIYIIFFGSVGISLISISLGYFGFTASESGSDENTSFRQLLSYISSLSYLAIVLWIYVNYKKNKSRLPLYIMICVQAFLGILYGHKSQVMFPFLFAVIAIFSIDKKFEFKYFAFFAGAVFIAYSVIQPFRYYYAVSGRALKLTSSTEILEAYNKSREYESKVNTGSVEGIYGGFLDRINYTEAVAAGVDYADKNNFYIKDAWFNTLLTPLYLMPRAIISFKPRANFTGWYAVSVMNSVEGNHISPLSYGYFYMAGRELGILFGFLIIGIIQFCFYKMFYLNPFYKPLYITFILYISNPGPEYWSYMTAFLQLFIFSFLIYQLLFRYKLVK